MRIEVVRTEAELGGQKMVTRKVAEGARRAELKLLYLLSLPCEGEVVPLDTQLAQFHLVDLKQQPGQLVDQALRSGPGVQELANLVAIVGDGSYESHKGEHIFPVLEMSVGEGLFGAGPGSRLGFDNRLDMGFSARWNLTNLHLKREQDRVRQSQVQQVQLAFEDLKAKLVLGVRETFESLKSNEEQIGFALTNMERAEQNYQLSEARFRQNIKGASPSEVLLAIRTMNAAKLSYLNAIRDYDKAQIRLFALVGGSRN